VKAPTGNVDVVVDNSEGTKKTPGFAPFKVMMPIKDLKREINL
jgi:hypothetical protein